MNRLSLSIKLALVSTLAFSLQGDFVDARRSRQQAPPPEPEPVREPYGGGYQRSYQQPVREPVREPEPARQPSHGAAPTHREPAGPVFQPDKNPTPGKQKSDDGADQDDENDPEWYKSHSQSYPCYKLTEQALFNFEQMRNVEEDWQVTDTRGRHISFNFCTYADATAEGCQKESFAFMKAGSKCVELTSEEPKAELNDFVERASQIKQGEDQEGIRLTRAGGAVCQEDSTQLYGVTIDVWCNPDVTMSPSQIHSSPQGPLDDDDADPCNIYISMEHANGCVTFDLHPFLVLLGSFMIMSGVCLQWLGPQAQQKFMVFIVRFGTFLIIISFAYSRNYLALLDPSEPPQKKDPVKCFIAIVFAFLAQWIIGWLFRYSMRIAPTLLGVYMGYYFSIYIIIAINGLGGMFAAQAKATHDTIDPIMSTVYEGTGCFIGGVLGYCYSAAFIALVQTFLSAFLIVRGTTMFQNYGWPNELILMQSTSTEQNNLVKLPTAFYIYSFAILVLWIIFFRSYLRRRDSPENQKYIDEQQN